MRRRIGLQRVAEHWQQQFGSGSKEVEHQMIVVPKKQRSLHDLEVLTLDTLRDAASNYIRVLVEVLRYDKLEHLLELIEELDLRGCARQRPVLDNPGNDLHGGRGILFYKLHNAIGKLLVVEPNALGAV